MARKTVLIDDLDGSEEDVRTVKFSYDGESYTIDLGPKNREKLRAALDPFTAKAHPNERRATEERSRIIREWAKQSGHALSPAGRSLITVLRAFEEAQDGK